MDRPDPAGAELAALLDEVHDRLRRGDLAALGMLTLRMERAEAGLAGLPREELLAIRQKAERNARTLAATRRGMKAARRRIAEVLSAARGLVTYDRQGQRVEEREAQLLARRF